MMDITVEYLPEGCIEAGDQSGITAHMPQILIGEWYFRWQRYITMSCATSPLTGSKILVLGSIRKQLCTVNNHGKVSVGILIFNACGGGHHGVVMRARIVWPLKRKAL
jgi:hypothetical protein